MKKLMSMFLATTLFTFSLGTSVSASDEVSTDLIQIPSNTVYSLDAKGEKLGESANFVSSSVDINSIESNGPDSVSLSGNVKTSTGDKAFQLTGGLKKAGYTDSLIVGELKDNKDNFEVVYFGIDRKPNSNLSLLRDKFENDATVIKLYLLEKNTRTFTFLETDQLNDQIHTDQIFNNLGSFEDAEHTDMFWYGKVFEPVQEEAQDGLTTFAAPLASGKSDRTYTAVYNAGIAKITEKMTVRAYVEGPTSLSGGNFTTKLYPLSVSTTSSVGSVNSKTSGWRIGVYQDTTLEAYTDPGDVIRSIQWSSTYSTPEKIQINVAWGLSVPNTGLSFGVGYTNSQTLSEGTSYVYDNSGSTKVRRTKLTLPKGKKLELPTHSFNSIISVGHYNTPKQKTLNLKFNYYISNVKDPYNSVTGPQTHNLAFSYSSK